MTQDNRAYMPRLALTTILVLVGFTLGMAQSSVQPFANLGLRAFNGALAVNQTGACTTLGPVTNGANLGLQASSGALNVCGDFTYLRSNVENVSVSKTITNEETNETYINGSDVDGVAFTLPDDPTFGVIYRFAVTTTISSSTMSIVPNTGESLYLGTSACSSITMVTKGSTLTLEAIFGGGSGIWASIGSTGSQTCVP